MIFWIISFCVMGTFLFGTRWLNNNADGDTWYATGEALMLPTIRARGSRRYMAGPIGDFQLEISTITQRATLLGTTQGTMLVALSGGLPTNLEMYPSRLLSSTDFQLDDPRFDAAVRIVGDETTALAVLDADTRQHLTSIVRRGLHLECGELVIRFRGSMNGNSLVSLVNEMHQLAKRLDLRTHPLALRLAHNLRVDPVASVRRRCLEAYAQLNVDAAPRSHLLAAARQDVDPSVRLAAAVASGVEGYPTLQALIEQPIAIKLREIAMTHLGLGSLDLVRDGLPRWLNDPALRSTVAHWAVYLEFDTIIDAVSEPSLPAAAALDVVKAQRARAQCAALIALLPHTDRDVQLAVIEALTDVGDHTAISVLQPLSNGTFTNRAIKQAAQKALGAITQRMDGSTGGLALSEVALEGTLALSEDAKKTN